MSRAIRSSKEFFFSLKYLLMKRKYKNKLTAGSELQILEKSPIIKAPKNGKIIIGDNVVLNSDFINSNTSLTTIFNFKIKIQ